MIKGLENARLGNNIQFQAHHPVAQEYWALNAMWRFEDLVLHWQSAPFSCLTPGPGSILWDDHFYPMSSLAVCGVSISTESSPKGYV